MHLVQSLVKTTWQQSPRLYLVTSGGQAVGSSQVKVEQSPLWGFGRTIRHEHPEFKCTCIDLDSKTDTLQPLFDVLATEETQIALRENQTYVARLAKQTIATNSKPIIRNESCYLITGGTGSLGLQLAEWFAEQGAEHLILMSRQTKLNESIKDKIAKIEQTGTKIHLAKADVSKESELKQVLEEIQPAPLRGIIHAAGVLDDGMIMSQNWQRFEKVINSKIYGAWNLHQLTKHLPLDFFVMFSSAAAILGNQGQSNYAAANAFLDSLAHQRHQQGLVATTINWGPWAQGGMASSTKDIQKNLSRQGFKPLKTVEALELMTRIISAKVTQMAVMPCNWQQYSEQMVDKTLFADLIQKSIKPALVEDFAIKLKQAEPTAQHELLLNFVSDTAKQVLGTELDKKASLMEQGMDSLLTVDMRNLLSKGLSISLPVSILFNYPSINKLVDYLATEVLQINVEKSRPNKFDYLDDLSPDELESLIKDELA